MIDPEILKVHTTKLSSRKVHVSGWVGAAEAVVAGGGGALRVLRSPAQYVTSLPSNWRYKTVWQVMTPHWSYLNV